MADTASSPGRLEVFRTLREGPSLLGLTLSLLPLAFVPFLRSDLVSKAAGPVASVVIVLPTIAGTFILLFLLSCPSILVAAIVYPHLRAQVVGANPAGPPETEGVPA